MKTIFITLFEGVEAKNILRTEIVPTILKDPNVRIVFLMKSEERIERYKKEFPDKRLLYEVAPYSRVPTPGLDAFFGWLKFALLRTDTTDLSRKMIYEIKKNPFTYYGGFFLNRIIARRFFITLARFFDFLLVRNTIYTALFEKYKPELVLCAHLFEEPEIHVLREAKRRGIKTIGLVNSWDKATTRCIIRLLPDRLIVFTNCIKREVVAYHGMCPENIFVGGIPQYDRYITGPFSERQEFLKRVGIDPAKKIILYAPMGRAFSDSDWEMIDRMHELNSAGAFGHDVDILVRFQPNDYIESEELKKRPHIKYDYPGLRFTGNDPFSPTRGVDWDMNDRDLQHLTDTLRFISVLVSYATSLVVDAALCGKPTVFINFELTKSPLMLKSPTHYYQKTHIQKVIRTGGVRLAMSEEDLIEMTRRYLIDSSFDHAARERLVREQCEYTDGMSGRRIGYFILEYLYS